MKVQKFIPSSRISALVNSSSKSIGASCNTYQAQDSIESIADAHAWSYHVLAYQGAPSVDFSKLRPRGSKLGTGGVSSGAVSFMKPFDAIVSTMRREEKKNGAGIAYLDYDHPDLQEFLDAKFDSAYKGVWIPMHGTYESERFIRNKKLTKQLADAYNNFKCFLVKKPEPIEGEPLLVNLCTEVEIPSRGSCILGAHNLAAYATLQDFADNFPDDFLKSTYEMYDYFCLTQSALRGSPLQCTSVLNRQFGLGVLGLASILGKLGITYEELGSVIASAMDASDDSLPGALAFLASSGSPSSVFAQTLIEGYFFAARAMRDKVRAAFCIQPTVSTAQRTYDYDGFHVSPEIQPVIGLRHDDVIHGYEHTGCKGGVSTIIKSAIKGDRLINYNPRTWTLDETPYEAYALVSNGFQRILDATGLGHRHSHCFYGKTFDAKQLVKYYNNPLYSRIKSLYYRLPFNMNVDSLKKDKLWQDVSPGEIANFDVDALLNGALLADDSIPDSNLSHGSSCQVYSSEPSCECAG